VGLCCLSQATFSIGRDGNLVRFLAQIDADHAAAGCDNEDTGGAATATNVLQDRHFFPTKPPSRDVVCASSCGGALYASGTHTGTVTVWSHCSGAPRHAVVSSALFGSKTA
jgi:hypothetical protein